MSSFFHLLLVFLCKLTGVDEKLIGDSRVIYIMDGAGKQGGEDLQISKHSLGKRAQTKLLQSKPAWLCVYSSAEIKRLSTSSAGVDSKTCVDWTTSAAWMLL